MKNKPPEVAENDLALLLLYREAPQNRRREQADAHEEEAVAQLRDLGRPVHVTKVRVGDDVEGHRRHARADGEEQPICSNEHNAGGPQVLAVDA